MKNEFFIIGSEVFIKLSSRNNDIQWTIIDIEDFSKINEFNRLWVAKPSESQKTYYAIVNIGNRRRVYMHRLVVGISNEEDSLFPDHKNRNGLDNRRYNLHIVTKSINMFNKDPQRNNSSGITGVLWRKDIKKWQARIKINGKTKYLGCFKNKEDAIEARLKAEDAYV